MTTITGQVLGPDGNAPAAAPDRQVIITLVDLSGVARIGYLAGGELVTTTILTANRDGTWSANVTGNAAITSDWGTTLYRVEEGYSPDRRGAHTTYINVPTTGGPYWIGDLRLTLPGGASPQLQGYLPISGGTMTGPITLSGDPATALQAATKQYVDNHSSGTSGGGAVSSVNGQTGTVVLTASNVGAIASGARNAANGVAGLDGSSLLSASQVPTLDASKISTGTLATARIPDLSASYIAVSQRNVAGGVAGLDNSSLIASGQIPTLDASKIGTGTLASGRIPDLSATYLTVVQRGAASGVASLDGSTLVPAAQIPVLTVSNISVAAAGNSAVGDTAAAGTATSLARSDHKHGREGFAAPGNSAVGDVAAAGSAVTLARSDHTHGREAFGTVTAQTSYAAASANGTAVTLARSDHVHGTPPLTSSAPGNSAVGDTAAVGTAAAPARADHTHGREGFGAVTAQTTFGLGSANGSAVTLARADHTHGTPAAPTPASIGAAVDYAYSPADYSLLGWVADPGYVISGFAPSTGVVHLLKVKVPTAGTISNVVIQLSGSSTLTSGQNYAAVFDTSGNRLGVTLDQSSSWTTTGTKVCPLTAPVSVAAGYVYVALLFNGTPANLGRYANSTQFSNANLPASGLRWAQSGSALTAMPSSISMGSIVIDASAAFWAGVS